MKLTKLLLIAITSVAITGCDSNDGAAEKAGRSLDKTVDKIEQSATDAGNAIEDACEDAKESAGAEDTDC